MMPAISKGRYVPKEYDGTRWYRVWSIIMHHRFKKPRENTEGELNCLRGEVQKATGARLQVLRRELRDVLTDQEYAYVFGSDHT